MHSRSRPARTGSSSTRHTRVACRRGNIGTDSTTPNNKYGQNRTRYSITNRLSGTPEVNMLPIYCTASPIESLRKNTQPMTMKNSA